MSKIRQIPVLHRKKPFGISPYEEFEMADKGNLIDEEVVHFMDISIQNYRYDSFTLFPGCIAKCTGSVKFSCQKIINGKPGETFQFSGKVVRHLAKLMNTDAVSGHNLSEKLSDLPVIKPAKNKVKNWVEKHHGALAKSDPETSEIETANPTGTPSFPSCRCDWSHAATASRSRQCCAHRGLCDECQGNLDDLNEDVREDTEKPKVHDVPHDDKEQSEDEEVDYEDDTCIVESVHNAAINPWEIKYPVHKTPDPNFRGFPGKNENCSDDYAELAARFGHTRAFGLCQKPIPDESTDVLEEDEIARVAAEFGYNDKDVKLHPKYEDEVSKVAADFGYCDDEDDRDYDESEFEDDYKEPKYDHEGRVPYRLQNIGDMKGSPVSCLLASGYRLQAIECKQEGLWSLTGDGGLETGDWSLETGVWSLTGVQRGSLEFRDWSLEMGVW